MRSIGPQGPAHEPVPQKQAFGDRVDLTHAQTTSYTLHEGAQGAVRARGCEERAPADHDVLGSTYPTDRPCKELSLNRRTPEPAVGDRLVSTMLTRLKA